MFELFERFHNTFPDARTLCGGIAKFFDNYVLTVSYVLYKGWYWNYKRTKWWRHCIVVVWFVVEKHLIDAV